MPTVERKWRRTRVEERRKEEEEENGGLGWGEKDKAIRDEEGDMNKKETDEWEGE